jgi:hypothetical protein
VADPAPGPDLKQEVSVRRRYRSFFWPVVLIAIGVIALLADLNVISSDRLYRLADLWPLILIVIGLELIARRTLHGSAVDVATILIVLIAAGGAIVYVSLGPAIPGGTHSFDASGQIGSSKTATLQVDVGNLNMTVEGDGSLGSDLYRAHIQYSGIKPTVDLDAASGVLHIEQRGGFTFFGNPRFVLDLQINPAVVWSFNINSGAANGTYRLSEIRVGGIELNTGASREDFTLGPPTGKVPITVNGGALTILVHRPVGTEASARVSGGAVNLTADGDHEGGIGSKSWQSDGYDSAQDAYRIEVNAGASTVTVDRAMLSKTSSVSSSAPNA